jgi:hypothetical protein
VQSLKSQTIFQLLWFRGLFLYVFFSIIQNQSNPYSLSNLPQAIERLTLAQDEAVEPGGLSLPRIHENLDDFVSLPIG